MPEDARARAGGDPADHAALARRVAALEDHDDARPLGFDPGLQPGKLDLKLREFLLEFLAAHLAGRGRRLGCLVLLLLVFCQLERSLSATGQQQSGNSPMILQGELSCLT